ncbi:unnamed protein product [Cuscuta europaea]|uniref:Phytocyanin domain-containing protein n=1 Tax=Cuscuta europaea TaxID=41803 RepID=A0A9P0YIV2_CUSEU|nr:unnamed protein product [Cuscuta europaea]
MLARKGRMEMGCNNYNRIGVMEVAYMFVLVLVAIGVEAQEHYVVGGDRGWETSNFVHYNYLSSSPRIFRVGDVIWFTYSAAQDNIVEVGSLEEYESCDLTNPIRMYTDGLNKISLDEEGIRYFTSGNIENCRNGLKLPVNVQPRDSKLAHSPSMGGENAPTPALATSPYSMDGEYWPTYAESPFGSGDSPKSSQSPYENRLGSRFPFNVLDGEEKWVKRGSVEAAHGPTSRSAPINLSGLFSLLAIGLMFYVVVN